MAATPPSQFDTPPTAKREALSQSAIIIYVTGLRTFPERLHAYAHAQQLPHIRSLRISKDKGSEGKVRTITIIKDARGHITEGQSSDMKPMTQMDSQFSRHECLEH